MSKKTNDDDIFDIDLATSESEDNSGNESTKSYSSVDSDNSNSSTKIGGGGGSFRAQPKNSNSNLIERKAQNVIVEPTRFSKATPMANSAAVEAIPYFGDDAKFTNVTAESVKEIRPENIYYNRGIEGAEEEAKRNKRSALREAYIIWQGNIATYRDRIDYDMSNRRRYISFLREYEDNEKFWNSVDRGKKAIKRFFANLFGIEISDSD